MSSDPVDEEVETRRHSRASWSENDAPPLPPRVSGTLYDIYVIIINHMNSM